MLIGIFKSNQQTVNALTVILTFVLWMPAFFVDLEVDFPQLISTNIKWLDIIISILLIAGQSIYLNFIVSEYKLVKENAHLTSLMLLLFNSSCLLLLNLNQVIIANAFILVAFHQLVRMYNLKNNYAALFNASLLISIASLIYLPSIVYFTLLLITLIYTTTPKWRDFVIALLGLSVPIVYFIVYQIVSGRLLDNNFINYFTPIFDVHWSNLMLFQKLFFILFLIVCSLASIVLLSIINKSVVRVKKMLTIVVLMLILGLGSLFLNRFDYLATFIMITIPMSIIVAIFFQNIKKRWLAETLFLFLLGGVILGYFS